MEFLSQQPDDVRHRFALAAREIPGIARPDALLAALLRHECALPPAIHHELHAEVAMYARALDARVLDVITASARAVDAAACNPHLRAADAEWLAVRCIAGILPATSMAEWNENRARRATFQRLVVRHRLRAMGLAGQVLFREACVCNGEYAHLAQQALGLYLHFPDVPPLHLERLAVLWRDHASGAAQVRSYRQRVEGPST